MEIVTDFIFLGSKITADSDCSHEIKRHLLPGRKVMTKLDSILKSRDITLPTNAHLVKATAFPVATYRCENWTIKKAEYQRINVFELWCLEKTLERSNQCILKELSPEYSLEGLMLKLKLQYFGHLMNELTPWKKLMLGKIAGRRRRIWQDEMVGWHHQCGGHEFEQALGVCDGQGSLACCSPWGHKELDTTEWLNWYPEDCGRPSSTAYTYKV